MPRYASGADANRVPDPRKMQRMRVRAETISIAAALAAARRGRAATTSRRRATVTVATPAVDHDRAPTAVDAVPLRPARASRQAARARPRAATEDPRVRRARARGRPHRAPLRRGARRPRRRGRLRPARPGALDEVELPVTGRCLRARRSRPRSATATRAGCRSGRTRGHRHPRRSSSTASRRRWSRPSSPRSPTARGLGRGRRRLPDPRRRRAGCCQAQLDPLPCDRDRRRPPVGALTSGLTRPDRPRGSFGEIPN